MTRTTAIASAVQAAVLLASGCARQASRPVQPVDARVTAASAIAPGTTFCNPLDIDYSFAVDTPSRRDAASPVVIVFNDAYFLFAAGSSGYWHSRDMRDWRFVAAKGLEVPDRVAAVLALDGRVYYTSSGSRALYASDDPLIGNWRKVATLASYDAPAFLHDDDGRVYLYHVAGQWVSVVELDPRDGFRTVGAPREVMRIDGALSPGGRPWVTKHSGTYYLEYSPPATGEATSQHAVFTSRSPTSGFTETSRARVVRPTGGFTGSAGDGSTFRDRAGGYWRVATLDVTVAAGRSRRLGIFPVRFDSVGTMRTDEYLGDYPRLLPATAGDHRDDEQTGWMLLSAGKTAAASSSLPGHEPERAFDEDARTWWSAATAGVGEWIGVDLGRIGLVNAIQINFAEEGTQALGRDEDSYEQYILESSIDGVHWTTRLDESHGTRDAPHRYVQLDTARNARYVRITNVHAAAGGNFAIRDLRIFGRSSVAPPPAVTAVMAQRQPADGRTAISWARSPRATSYVVRLGGAPDRMYASYGVGDTTTATIEGLTAGVASWFAVDAVGEGGVGRGRAKPLP